MDECKTNWHGIARTLWEEGVAFFSIDTGLIETARTGFKEFVKRRDELGDHAHWRFARPDEHENDLGLIQRNGAGYDTKSFLHHDHSYYMRLKGAKVDADNADATFLAANQRLLDAVNRNGLELVKALDAQYKIGCADNYATCQKEVLPYSTTTLRSLYYPDGPRQTGAKAHIDRSFLTIHLGDEGGSLQIMQQDGQWVNISPPDGFAVAFFGVKALWMTGGRKKPLKHRSVTFPGSDRFAFVHFGHVVVPDYYVEEAQTAYNDWRAQNTLAP